MIKSKISEKVKQVLLYINILFIFLLFTSYLSAWVSPNVLPMLSVMGYAYPVLLLINIFFILLWAIMRSIRFVYSLIAIVIGVGILFSHYQPFNNYVEDKDDIALLTFNMGHNIDLNIPNREKIVKQDSDMLQDFLDTIKADIICLQEGQLPYWTIYKMTEKRNLNLISRKYKDNNSYGLNLITISKYPIISTAELKHNGNIFALICDMVIDNDTIRVINTHLTSNSLTGKDIRDINDIMHLDSIKGSKIVNLTKRIATKFDRGAKLRTTQGDVIVNNIKHCPYKVIVCGDFNDTPATFAYSKISRGFTDAFIQKGYGWGNTFAGNLPSIRIDYVLCDKDFDIKSYKVFEDIKLSDHHPVRCVMTKK